MNKSLSCCRWVGVLIVFSIIFSNCKKEESDTLTTDEETIVATGASMAEVESQFTFNDIFDNVIGVNAEVGLGGVGIFGRITNPDLTARITQTDSLRCFTTTITPLQTGVFPKTVVIDFGQGCTSHGHTRSGKITTVYTGKLTVPGSSATTTFSNYKIDSISIEGTHRITNSSNVTSNQRKYHVEVIDAKLSKPSGNFTQWNSTRTITQIEGVVTPLALDDIFSITGSSRGKVKTTQHIYIYNSEIIEPLFKKFTCKWVSKGKVKVLRETLPAGSQWTSILDYGNGTCDNKATLTINGITHQITLR